MITFARIAQRCRRPRANRRRFKARGYDPRATRSTLCGDSGFAAAAEKAKSLKVADLSKARIDDRRTVIGPLSWNKKGDVTDPKYVLLRLEDGKIHEM